MSGRNGSPEQVRRGGRLLGVGVSGTTLTDEERRILEEVCPAAVVLFSRNVESPTQLQELIGSIRQASSPAPVFMIDQEGGRVDRLRTILPGIPAAEDFAGLARARDVYDFGFLIGLLLASFDIEVNLAPVVDIWREGRSPSLVNRCFGQDADAVAQRAAAFIDGMADWGVASCLKHFPGLGVAATDPHLASSVVDLDMNELDASDLAPYRLLRDVSPAVMVSHALYPKLDASDLPGTLSYEISTTLLRERVEFTGLAVTDDMEMHAVSDLAGPEEIAAQSVIAGNDLVLFCSRISAGAVIAGRLGELADRDETADRFAQASHRVERFVRQCVDWKDLREGAGGFEKARVTMGETLELLRQA